MRAKSANPNKRNTTTMKEVLNLVFATLIQPLIDAIDRNTAAVYAGNGASTKPATTEATDETPETPAPKKAKAAKATKPEPAPEPASDDSDLGLDDNEEKEAAVVTLQDIKTAAQNAIAAGNKPAIFKLLEKFGVEKITEVPTAKYAAFHAELKKLG